MQVCWVCGGGGGVFIEHRDREYHRQMNLLLSRFDEQQGRWYLEGPRNTHISLPVA
jgi:hypothetical protein